MEEIGLDAVPDTVNFNSVMVDAPPVERKLNDAVVASVAPPAAAMYCAVVEEDVTMVGGLVTAPALMVMVCPVAAELVVDTLLVTPMDVIANVVAMVPDVAELLFAKMSIVFDAPGASVKSAENVLTPETGWIGVEAFPEVSEVYMEEKFVIDVAVTFKDNVVTRTDSDELWFCKT